MEPFGTGGAAPADRGRSPGGRGVKREPRPLSARQEAVMAVVRSWIIEHGEGPTIREIGARVGLSSTSSVAYQLRQLEERGLISRTGGPGCCPPSRSSRRSTRPASPPSRPAPLRPVGTPAPGLVVQFRKPGTGVRWVEVDEVVIAVRQGQAEGQEGGTRWCPAQAASWQGPSEGLLPRSAPPLRPKVARRAARRCASTYSCANTNRSGLSPESCFWLHPVGRTSRVLSADSAVSRVPRTRRRTQRRLERF
ncbi:hypothetical protein ABTY00_37025 [Streptomyces microflavus]|uniref:LexA family protein n=1 Tax=Streptomyces microflavus TaxID=1919 RepID=UPI0033258879